MDQRQLTLLLESIVERLDIPPSHYEKAKDRYESLGNWLHRKESAVAGLSPAVFPQGSFRLGTVIRPLLKHEEYDLDLVCEVALSKSHVTQKHVKDLVGGEVAAYAEAYGIEEPVTEGNRCWRLDYADGVRFHEDILPALPEQQMIKAMLMKRGVSESVAARAICITDRRHPQFAVISSDWLVSNPRGYATWFEDRMRLAARALLEGLVQRRLYASVDDVPAYEWKTPLQRAIQLLKRHRDVMFAKDAACKPISIIITTLAARAYAGESDISSALASIVERMPGLVSNRAPRVPNPVNPAEDFADKWATDPRLEQNFQRWCMQLRTDLRRLGALTDVESAQELVKGCLGIQVGVDELRACGISAAGVDEPARAPAVVIKSAPRPWKHSDQTW